jgi:diaminopimelate epimerase
VRGDGNVLNAGFMLSGFGLTLSVAAAELSVFGFGGMGTSLAGGTTTCAFAVYAAMQKKTPTMTPRRERRIL